MTAYPSRLANQYVVRFPEGWRDVIKARAARNRRSMNNEIISAIEWIISEEVNAGAKIGVQTPAPTPSE